VTVEPLGREDARHVFSCGVESLDRYLQQQATQDVRRKAAAVFVLTDPDHTVLGYYTLSAATVAPGVLPPEIVRRLPRYPQLPATLLGRLAVSTSHQGRGLGEYLLLDALRRSLENTSAVGSVAILVDALDDRAKAFYASYGFLALPDSSRRLFLPMATVERLFQCGLHPPLPH
jgi:predicted GNAT family N-acyltransferase